MATDYAWRSGGLRYIHADIVTSGQPANMGLIGALAHNQHLINHTFGPRQIANDLIPLDASHERVLVNVLGIGACIAQWPMVPYRDGVEVVARCYGSKVGTNDPVLWLLSTPALLRGDERLTDLLVRLAGSGHADDETVSHSTDAWSSLRVLPQRSIGGYYYLSLWARTDGDPGDSSTLRPRVISVRERRRSGF